MLISALQDVFWAAGSPSLEYLGSLPWTTLLLAPAAGGLIVGLMVHYAAPEAKGHGVPEVMEAIVVRGGRIRPRVVAIKTLASGVCIASGGSVGREGPIVQIGASLGSTFGQILGLGVRRIRTIAACGAAAGIAATFNAPIAGALFAVEVLLRDMRLSQFSPLVVAAVCATAVSREMLGDGQAFLIPQYALQTPWELAIYVVLGLLAGVLAVVFIRTLYFAEDRFEAMNIWPPLITAIGGVCVGGVAILYPEVLGNGYESIGAALVAVPAWKWLVAVALAKLISVCFTLGTGGSGGIFAPSLFIGGMAGGLIGVAANSLFPGSVGPVGAYALVGMGATVAATTHAPLTAIIIMFELTGDYRIILPLMIASTLATRLTTWNSRESIYTMKLTRRGVDLHKGRDVNVLRDVPVQRVLRPVGEAVPASMPGVELLAMVASGDRSEYVVCDETGHPTGMISLDALRPLFAAGNEARARPAGELARPIGEPLHMSDTMDTALVRMQTEHAASLPVVEDGDVQGWVHLEDILTAYRAEIFKRDMVQGMADAFGSTNKTYAAAGGIVIREGDAPFTFDGRSLGALELRKRFGVTVLVIKREADGVEEILVPNAETPLCSGDRLLVMGKAADIHRALSD